LSENKGGFLREFYKRVPFGGSSRLQEGSLKRANKWSLTRVYKGIEGSLKSFLKVFWGKRK
jgi:hypothetical protein